MGLRLCRSPEETPNLRVFVPLWLYRTDVGLKPLCILHSAQKRESLLRKLTFGFLASHTGTNLQTVVRAIQTGQLRAVPGVVISNNADSGALRFAKAEGIPWRHLSGRTYSQPDALDEAILATLNAHKVDVVLLLGYMKLLGPKTVAAYKGRALNIHPALLPKFGGKGMYGLRVHQAVLDAGKESTGVTIHLVDELYDHGQIIAQSLVPVEANDTAETLAARVLKEEHRFLIETLAKIIEGEIKLPGERGSGGADRGLGIG